MIQQMKIDYPVRQLCATLDCPTSTAYYVPQNRDESDRAGGIHSAAA